MNAVRQSVSALRLGHAEQSRTAKPTKNVWDSGVGQGEFHNVFNVAVHSDEAIQAEALCWIASLRSQ